MRAGAYHPDVQGATLFIARVERSTLGDSAATLVWLAGVDGDEAAGAARIGASCGRPRH